MFVKPGQPFCSKGWNGQCAYGQTGIFGYHDGRLERKGNHATGRGFMPETGSDSGTGGGLEGEDLIEPVLGDERKTGKGPGLEVGFLLLILGLAIGAVLATFGLELFADNASVIFSAMFGLVLFLVALFVLLVLLRRSIWQKVFRRTELEIERIAAPLSDVARHAAEKDVPRATNAARSLAELVLARYAWLATRRWLIASITGMIAAIAALAGSALLFQQNELLKEQGKNLVTQTQLLSEQNARIDTQIELLQTDAQLKDSDRSANILPDIVAASAKLGEEIQALHDEGNFSGNGRFRLEDISLSLRNQLITITNTVRPYRYLKSDTPNVFNQNQMNEAAFRRRDDLPRTAQLLGLGQKKQSFGLIDRPLSPERGAIIGALHNFNIRETELLSFFGADFSYAEVSMPQIISMSFQHANLQFSDFGSTDMVDVDFSAAALDNMRLRGGKLTRVDFAGHQASDAPGLFRKADDPFFMATRTSGLDLSGSVIFDCTFEGTQGIAPNFDGAVLARTRFVNASIPASTFRNAILVETDFTGAALQSADFDGAIVFEANFLERLQQQSQTGTFKRERYSIEAVDVSTLQDYPLLGEFGIYMPAGLIEGKQAFLISRTAPFEE